ncbi:MAG: peptide-binding protein [Nitrospirae bacterium]|nr:peptide-binding protein [Nitrospirota bacterium]MBI3352814.1 peptide-binding protein [Nitrospirota bacterium]
MKKADLLFYFSFLIVLSGFTGNSKSISVGSIGDAQKLNPILASDGASGEVSGWIFNGLVKYDPTLNLVPDLAENFESSPDCKNVTFHLRKGVKWHDGKEVTAEDVLFTYQKIIDPKVATPYSGGFDRIDKVKIITPYQVNVSYKESFAPGLENWGLGIIPKHLLEGKDLQTDSFNQHPVGTGPYKLKTWTPQQKIVLVSNPDYFEGAPDIQQYIFRVIPDSATMFLELRSGNLDYMGLTPVQFQKQTESPFFKKKFNKFQYPSFSYTYLGYNLLNPLFSDKTIRQALTYAIDRQTLIDGVWLGYASLATGPLPPDSWAYNPDVKPYPYDPGKAKRMLAQAGWIPGPDGILRKNGKKFEFTIMTNQGNDERKKSAEIIQFNLNQVGIKVNIQILEWQALLHQYIDKKKFDAIILGWGLGRDPDAFDIWYSKKTKEGEFNFISYNNPKVDQLLIEGRKTCDKEKRKKIYHEFHALIAEDQPYTFLYYPQSLPILANRFSGVKVTPIGIWYNFPQWKVLPE